MTLVTGGSSQSKLAAKKVLFSGNAQFNGLYRSCPLGSTSGLLMMFLTMSRARGPARAVVFNPACGTLVLFGPTIWKSSCSGFHDTVWANEECLRYDATTTGVCQHYSRGTDTEKLTCATQINPPPLLLYINNYLNIIISSKSILHTTSTIS